MPQMNTSRSDELVCRDEVKVYNEEGEEEEQQKSSENLTEDKVGLVIEGEGQNGPNTTHKNPFIPPDYRFPPYFFSHPFSPYHSPYSNGVSHGFSNKMALGNPMPPFYAFYEAFHQSPAMHGLSMPDKSMPPPPGFYAMPTTPSPIYPPSDNMGWAVMPPRMPSPLTPTLDSPSSIVALAALRASPYSPHPMVSPHHPFSQDMLAATMAYQRNMLSLASHQPNSPSHSLHLHPNTPSPFSLQPPAPSASPGQPSTSTGAAKGPPSNTPTKKPTASPTTSPAKSPAKSTPKSVSAEVTCPPDFQTSAPSKPPCTTSKKTTVKSSTNSSQSSTSDVISTASDAALRHQIDPKKCLQIMANSQSFEEKKSTSEATSEDQTCGNRLTTPTESRPHPKVRKVHVKKPLNAFMLFMKEMRPTVQEECTLKESAAINQILGKKWHELAKDKQTRYYEMARKEKEEHARLHPEWSARDNYAMHSKRKKKRRGGPPDALGMVGAGGAVGNGGMAGDGGSDSGNPKKCRARYGLEQQSQWCKPCRRKKKCIRFIAEVEEAAALLSQEEKARNEAASSGEPYSNTVPTSGDEYEDFEEEEEEEMGPDNGADKGVPLSPPRLYRQQSPCPHDIENGESLSPICMPLSPVALKSNLCTDLQTTSAPTASSINKVFELKRRLGIDVGTTQDSSHSTIGLSTGPTSSLDAEPSPSKKKKSMDPSQLLGPQPIHEMLSTSTSSGPSNKGEVKLISV